MKKSFYAVLLAVGAACGGQGDSTTNGLTILAPAAPGGGWDQTARAMQTALQTDAAGVSVRVVNVAGAGGTVGLARFVNTDIGRDDVLLVTGLIMVGAVVTNQSAVSLEATTPIARLTGDYEVLVVPESSPYADLAAFLDAWKQDPGAFAIAGGSAGGTDHMLAGLLAARVGMDPTTINYVPHSGGGESIASILGEQVTAGINGLSELVAFIESGRMRALAISSEMRLPERPIPTFVEQGVDLTLTNWRGVVGPPNLTDQERSALTARMDAMRESESWRATLAQNGWLDQYLSGVAFETFLDDERVRATDVLRSIGLTE
ncbi:MAG: tripartite tricarboxylate transporter substrate-binding protein [Acidobacteriota bacterium]|nr:tripartite tricarboxylate transporter substrate-binding protein [Acidobacteriota bacterium]